MFFRGNARIDGYPAGLRDEVKRALSLRVLTTLSPRFNNEFSIGGNHRETIWPTLNPKWETAKGHIILTGLGSGNIFANSAGQNNPAVNRPHVLYKLVRCHAAVGKYAEAVSEAQDFLAHYSTAPEQPEIRFHLALALKELGRNNESLQQVLSLLVDENGRVLDVRLERGIQQNVGINEAANAAARSAKFRPATKDGVPVSRIFKNEDFGYRTITVERPLHDADGKDRTGYDAGEGAREGSRRPHGGSRHSGATRESLGRRRGYALSASFWITTIGGSRFSMTSSEMTISRTFRRLGTSYMMSSIAFSRMARRPRAPALLCVAARAMARSAPSVNLRFTPSISRSFLYCFTSAFRGFVRMSMSDGSSSSSSVVTTGSRPTTGSAICTW